MIFDGDKSTKLKNSKYIRCLTVAIGTVVIVGCQLFDNEIKGQVSVTDPALRISIEASTLTEKDMDFLYSNIVKVKISKVVNEDVSVTFSIVDNYAITDLDYKISLQEVTIKAGDLSAFIPVLVFGDLIGKGTKDFSISLVGSSKGNVLSTPVKIEIIDNDPIILSVLPTYPLNGLNWNDYIAYEIDAPKYKQNDVVCFFSGCLHGAEFKKVEAIGQHSCDKLSLEDNLSVFDWVCDSETDPVYFYSRGLKTSMGLTDIVDPLAFKSMNVVLKYDNVQIAQSNFATDWWGNPFLALVDNSGGADPLLTLSVPSTIYTLGVSRATRGIEFDAEKVSLVLLNGAVLSPTPTLLNDCDGGGGTQQCLLLLTNHYQWVEGSFLGGNMISDFFTGVITIGEFLIAANFIQLRNIDINAAGGANGIYLTYNHELVLDDVAVKNALFNGIYNRHATFSVFNNISVTNNGSNGLYVGNLPSFVKHTNITASNNGDNGVYNLSAWSSFFNIKTNNNRLSGIREFSSSVGKYLKVLSFNNGEDGMRVLTVKDRSFISQATLTNNIRNGLFSETIFPGTTDAKFRNLLIRNNMTGLAINSIGGIFHNLYVTGNGTGIYFDTNSDNNIWTGTLSMNNTLNCGTISAGSNPGLLNADCDNAGSSSASRSLGVDDSNIIVGPITLADTVNTHNVTSLLYDSITDWLQFDNPLRGWGKSVPGACIATETCDIIDSSLKNSALDLLDRNGTFLPNLQCPDSVNGESQIHDTSFGEQFNFIINAAEILGDHIGNEDGFCNSNEDCIFYENLSYDQLPRGASYAECLHADSLLTDTVTGVKMFGYY